MTAELATRDPELLARLMTKDEAREAVAGIKRAVGSLRAKLVELDEREGWRALGYASIEACCAAELGWRKSHLYRQLRAADVEKNVGSPIGEQRESHLRPLAGKTPEVQRQAWEAAGRDGERSALSVRRAVEKAEGTTTTRSNPSQLFTARGEPNATQEPEGGLDLEPDTAPMSVAEMAAAQREFENRGLGSDATQEPERADSRADAGTGQAGAEASVQDAREEEADEPTLDFSSMDRRSRAAAAVYTMDPGLDDWLVGEIDRAYLRENGLDLTALITLARLTISRSTDQTRAAMVCRGLLDESRGRK